MGKVSLQGHTPGVTLVAAAGLVGVPVFLLVFLWAVENTSYDVWGAFVIGPLLLLLTLPLARHVARLEDDPVLVKIVMWALVLKLLASLVRYFVAFEVYGGSADASVYIREGRAYAESLRNGVFTYTTSAAGGEATFFIRRVTGFVFFLVGPTAIGGFLVFAWGSFWGLYLFYRAFRLGVPQGDHRRYAKLVFFLPTLLFWPSSIGKEAWMLLALGIGAYGAARLLTHRSGGYLLLAIGILAAAQVREHMAALLAAGLVAGVLLRRSNAKSAFGPVVRVISGAAVFGALLFAMSAAQERFGIEGGLSGVEQAIDDTAEQTSQGGSEFEAKRPDSLLDVPLAVFTVMFRPLPHEAHNTQALLTSLEGVFLLGIVALSLRRLRPVLREAWRTPYLAFAGTYSLLFMLAFSSFGNFGILARQRAQLFPFVLVLLSLPAVAREHRGRGTRSPRSLVTTTDTGRPDRHSSTEPRT